MSWRAAATHGEAGTPKLIAHGDLGNTQLGTDLAQGPTLGVQIGCALNVHGATVTSHGRIGFAAYSPPLGNDRLWRVFRPSGSAVLAPDERVKKGG
jgi:hypothetical protein